MPIQTRIYILLSNQEGNGHQTGTGYSGLMLRDSSFLRYRQNIFQCVPFPFLIPLFYSHTWPKRLKVAHIHFLKVFISILVQQLLETVWSKDLSYQLHEQCSLLGQCKCGLSFLILNIKFEALGTLYFGHTVHCKKRHFISNRYISIWNKLYRSKWSELFGTKANYALRKQIHFEPNRYLALLQCYFDSNR